MMFARTGVLSLVLSCILSDVAALDLDVNSQDSVKDNAKSLASGIVSFYNETVTSTGIPGLFPKPYYWWETGTVLNSLVEYSYLTGDTQYDALVSEGIQWQLGDRNAFMPPNQTKALGNDDQSSWALAAMTAAEVGFQEPKNGSWVDFGANAFDTQTQRWDTATCNGGLRWQIFTFNSGYDYKNMASNSKFFLLAARLARFTGNATYAQWAEKSYSWANDTGLISADYHIYDGSDATSNCSSINHLQWTNDHGIMTEGAALMYNITGGSQKWAKAVKGFVNASSIFLENGILTEVACELNSQCSVDLRAFKGVAARSFARAAIAAPIVAEPLTIMLQASAKAAANACSGSDRDVKCSLLWFQPDSGEQNTASGGNLGEVFDALEVVQGLLYPQAKALATGNVTTGDGGANATRGAAATGTESAGQPVSTGSAGTIAASITAVLGVVCVAALSY